MTFWNIVYLFVGIFLGIYVVEPVGQLIKDIRKEENND